MGPVIFYGRHFDVSQLESTGADNQMNEGRDPFSCSRVQGPGTVQADLLPHCHGLLGHNVMLHLRIHGKLGDLNRFDVNLPSGLCGCECACLILPEPFLWSNAWHCSACAKV